jgi:hypothetical protein
MRGRRYHVSVRLIRDRFTVDEYHGRPAPVF